MFGYEVETFPITGIMTVVFFGLAVRAGVIGRPDDIYIYAGIGLIAAFTTWFQWLIWSTKMKKK